VVGQPYAGGQIIEMVEAVAGWFRGESHPPDSHYGGSGLREDQPRTDGQFGERGGRAHRAPII
jgi:hypothetical protein